MNDKEIKNKQKNPGTPNFKWQLILVHATVTRYLSTSTNQPKPISIFTETEQCTPVHAPVKTQIQNKFNQIIPETALISKVKSRQLTSNLRTDHI